MMDCYDIIVVGSGGLGAATAYYLAKEKGSKVALLDQHAIGSQTSPRAAGMVSCLRKTTTMIELILDACEKIEHFTEETAQPLDWVCSGSLKIARRAVDAEVLRADFQRGQSAGLDLAFVPVNDVRRHHPFVQPDGIDCILGIINDRYFDPAQLAKGYANAAAANGAVVLPNTRVVNVAIEGRRVTGVETPSGRLQAPIVVDAAGAWTRALAALSNVEVPLVPTRQQLIVTEEIPGAVASLPMVRIMDAAVYMRPCAGGFLWGVYEEQPRFFDMQALGPDFDIGEMPLDRAVLDAAAADVAPQLPILRSAAVRELRGGIPTMTADGQHILGPSSDITGFFFASGCNVAGLSISPTLGEMLARWILDGRPPRDLQCMSLSRFADKTLSEEALQQAAAWQYRHFYGAV
jgi:glycine/D-amino acid oxidase-like deaminating enzyme